MGVERKLVLKKIQRRRQGVQLILCREDFAEEVIFQNHPLKASQGVFPGGTSGKKSRADGTTCAKSVRHRRRGLVGCGCYLESLGSQCCLTLLEHLSSTQIIRVRDKEREEGFFQLLS